MSELELQWQIKSLEARLQDLERHEKRAIACRAYNSVDFSHNSSGNSLAVTLDSDRSDPLDMHSTSTNTSRITVPVAGWYLISAHVSIAANATGVRILEIRSGGSTIIARIRDNNPSASTATALSLSTIYYLSSVTYFEMYVYQNSGGTLAATAVPQLSPELAVIRLP